MVVAGRRVASLTCCLVLVSTAWVPVAMAHGGDAAHPNAARATDLVGLLSRQLEDPEGAGVAAAVAEGGYPLSPDPVARFADFEVRTDLAEAGDLEDARRVMRFAHVTDLQLVDDDAPYPMRQGLLDAVFGATISGGAQRPHEEYSDEILWSLVDVLNVHHGLDPVDFAIHTGDNIDNALENELMRYLDIVEGTHTTTGPVSGFACEPDGQSESVDDDSHDVVTSCTSVPEHLVAHLRGLAPDMPWFSLYGNHDGLIQGNVNIAPGFQETAEQFGRYFLREEEYVRMHFADGDPCGGGSAEDDWGHGYGFADDRLCNDTPEDDAYYAFDHRGARLVALDTVNDEVAATQGNDMGLLPGQETTGYDAVSGLSEGAIDVAQFQWIQRELDLNEGRIVLIFAHHTVDAFYDARFDPACGPPGCVADVLRESGFITRADMQEELGRHPNMVGFFGGHTHQHRVTPQTPNGTSPGYWNVETSGLLDLPQESRIVEMWVTADGGKGVLALDPIGHLFGMAQDLAATDDQHDAEEAAGTPGDRRVLLWFDIPEGVSLDVGPQPPGSDAAGLIDLTLFEPLDTDEVIRLEAAGEQRLEAVVIERQGTQRVSGLEVSFAVTEIETPAGEPVTLDYSAFPLLEDEGDGRYTGAWDFDVPGNHTGTFRVEDPARFYPTFVQTYTFVVPAPPEPDEGIPGPGAGLGLLAVGLAVVFMQRRR